MSTSHDHIDHIDQGDTPMSDFTTDQIQHWHRKLCWVTPWMALSGDLDIYHHEELANQIVEWEFDGITDVLDVRIERSDEALLRQCSPEMTYWHVPTDDAGGRQSHEWFTAGLTAMAGVFDAAGSWLDLSADTTGWTPDDAAPQRRVVVHCHMGVNRGPSMGYRLLLAAGWDPIGALDAIRAARPIANIAYAEDALADHLATVGVSETEAFAQVRQVRAWHADHPIDVHRIINRINRYAA